MTTQKLLLIVAILCGLMVGCHRAPSTAAELQRNLPRRYRGEIHLQGEPQPRRIVVEPSDFTLLDAHTLEFNHVRYELLSGNEAGAAGDVQVRGTISAPALAIHLESVPGSAEVDGGDALRTGSFSGALSGDLQTLKATWKTGFGQGVILEVRAGP